MIINSFQSNRNNSQPAFSSVKLLSGAEETLRNNLKILIWSWEKIICKNNK